MIENCIPFALIGNGLLEPDRPPAGCSWYERRSSNRQHRGNHRGSGGKSSYTGKH